MAEIKSRILYILKYLWHNTDAEHYATTGDILTYLKENGISCDRKTIPGDIAKLCDIGIDIEEERSRENRYSLSSHLFTLPEVKLLMDAVESSKFITAKKSSELANKLSQMTSVYQSEELKRNIYISERVKPMNPVWEKYALTVKEAAEYYNIAETKLRDYLLANRDAPFVLKGGARLLVKRKMFEMFLDESNTI